MNFHNVVVADSEVEVFVVVGFSHEVVIKSLKKQ